MKLLSTFTPALRSTTLRTPAASLRPLAAARCYSTPPPPHPPVGGNPLPAGPGESGSQREAKEKGAVGVRCLLLSWATALIPLIADCIPLLPSPSRLSPPHHATKQPFTLKAAALFGLTGAGLWYYFQTEKAALKQRKDQETATAKIGRPKIGGPFVLTDQDGEQWSSEQLLGRWSLVYVSFGAPARERAGS